MQLPPEALDGLSSTELAAIVNFVAPADGVGTVTPLPVLTGVVTGTVFEGDGVTVASSATVTYQSDSPFFNRRMTVTADALGAFEFRGLSSGQRPVPVEGFKLYALPREQLGDEPAGVWRIRGRRQPRPRAT